MFARRFFSFLSSLFRGFQQLYLTLVAVLIGRQCLGLWIAATVGRARIGYRIFVILMVLEGGFCNHPSLTPLSSTLNLSPISATRTIDFTRTRNRNRSVDLFHTLTFFCVFERNRGLQSDMPSGLSGAEKMSGVGITFVEDVNGALYVKSLVPGGSAADSGQVQVGDEFSYGKSYLSCVACCLHLKNAELVFCTFTPNPHTHI